MLKKIWWLILILILIIILITLSIIGYAYFATRNPEVGTLQLQGLDGKVTITRDRYGIPHIHAFKSDDDAFFALGFVQAQDRFWQMDIQRHIASGTLSEYFGQRSVAKDKFLRTWGFYRAATNAYNTLSPKTKEIIASYTKGVNAFLNTGHLPVQYLILRVIPKPWTNVDSIAWAKMMSFDLQDSWSRKIQNYNIMTELGFDQIKVLLPPYPKNAPTILTQSDLIQSGLYQNPDIQAFKKIFNSELSKQLNALYELGQKIRATLNMQIVPGKGSNNWVINGRLSKTGKPLLANDPHLGLQVPSIWYLAELRGPHLHVIGATLPGIPAVIIGHNDHIAWGVTNVDPDSQDLYIEPPNAETTKQTVMIKIRGEKPLPFIIEKSKHGPIISNVVHVKLHLKNAKQYKIALKWTALMKNDTSAEAFMELNYAKNWQDFTKSLSHFVTPAQNFVYADDKGNIGYYLAGKIPIRRNYSGALPIMPSQHDEWAGFIPFERLPHVLNPERDFIASANNKTVPSGYPYKITFRFKDPSYRIQRIYQYLTADSKTFSVDNFKKMQLDVKTLYWIQLKPYLMKTKALDSLSHKALVLLESWNGEMSRDSIAATIYASWYRQFTFMPLNKLHFTKDWRKPRFILQQLAENGSYCRETNEKNCDSYLSHSLQGAVDYLKNKFGSNLSKWRWGKVHHAEFDDIIFSQTPILDWLFNRYISAPGGYYTLFPGSYYINNFDEYHSAGFREIINFNDLKQSQFIIAPGESGDIFSLHYADLLQKWRDGKYITIKSPENNKDVKQLTLLPKS